MRLTTRSSQAQRRRRRLAARPDQRDLSQHEPPALRRLEHDAEHRIRRISIVKARVQT